MKRTVERAAIGAGVAGLARQRMRGRAIVLAYHNVIPDGVPQTGERSMHLPARQFISQLELLGRTHEVVPLTSLTTGSRSTGRPRVAITFDDAYEGALSIAVDELARRGMPATIFVPPGLLGNVPWWDRLADPATGALDPELRGRALDEFAGRSEKILAWRQPSTESSSRSVSLPRIGTEEELISASKHAGITVGPHSWSHPSLDSIPINELERELALTDSWLKQRFDNIVPWLSYPYGRFNENVERAALKIGYVAALRIEGGWLAPNSFTLPFALPRLNIPAGVSAEGFQLWLAGVGSF